MTVPSHHSHLSARALASHRRRLLHKGLVKVIMRWDDDATVDDDGDGVPDEVQEVRRPQRIRSRSHMDHAVPAVSPCMHGLGRSSA